MKRFLPSRGRTFAFGSLVLIALGATFVFLGAAAYAHHPEIEAIVDCEGNVSYTSTAWNGVTEESRTNPNIGVWYRTSDDSTWIALPSGAYNASNGFSFSGAFTLPAPLPDWVQLKVQALDNWGNGAAAGESRETDQIAFPPPCDTPPPTVPENSTTTTTTLPPETTTTQPPAQQTTTTVAGATSSIPPAPPSQPEVQVLTTEAAPLAAADTLPYTGAGDVALIVIGVAAVGAGLVLAVAASRRSRA